MLKRIIAVCLCLVMVISMMPVQVFAEEKASESTGETAASTEETTAPAEETTAPAEETTVPAEETTASAEETTAPAEETTAPAEETTSSAEETTVSEEQDVVAGENSRTVAKSSSTSPANGTCGDNAVWSLDDAGTLLISGTGAMQDYQLAGKANNPNTPWYDLRESITGIIVSEGITTLGDWAFGDLEAAGSVSLPESLTALGRGSLSGCSALTEILLPEGITSIGASAFNGCGSLTSLEIPEGISRIEEYTFHECAAMWEINIPQSVTYIGEYAFYGCEELWDITIPAGVSVIEDFTFASCTGLWGVTLPEGLTAIGEDAFYDCSNLRDIDIPQTVTEIGCYAFAGCTDLRSLVIPDGVAEISAGLFEGCTYLQSIVIPDSVTAIGAKAFFECSKLCDVVLPETLVSIGNQAFDYCYALDEITIPASVTSIGGYAFRECGLSLMKFTGDAPAIAENAFTDAVFYAFVPAQNSTWTEDLQLDYGGSITWSTYSDEDRSGSCGEAVSWELSEDGTLTISGSGDMLDYETYNGKITPWYVYRKEITAGVIEQGVTGIGFGAFLDCVNLQTLSMADGVTRIGGSAFENCGSLEQIAIADSVTEIGAWAFSNCDSLEMPVLPSGLKTIGTGAFSGCYHAGDKIEIPVSVTAIGEGAFYGVYPEMVLFAGSAPEVELINDDPVFGSASAYAYYPEGDASWTEEAKAAYGENLIWIPYGEDPCSGSCGDDLTYRVDLQAKTLRISGTGPMDTWDGVDTFAPWGGFSEDILRVFIGAGVTTYQNLGTERCGMITFEGNAPDIAEDAFADMYQMPNGVVICYPVGDSSWDGLVGQDFGGTVVWAEAGSAVALIRDITMRVNQLTAGEVREEVQAIDRSELLAAMRSGIFENEYGTGEISCIEILTEDQVTIRTDNVPGLTALGSSRYWWAEGVTLNDPADPAQGHVVLYSESEDPISVPEGYDAQSAVPFRLSISNLQNQTWLTVPVKATISHNWGEGNPFFYSLFWRSSQTGEIEEIPLRLRWHKAGFYMDFVLEGTGEFLLVQRQDAMTGSCGDNLTWTFTKDSVLTISGEGAMDDYDTDQNRAPWYYFREQMEQLVIGEAVTGIGDYAFEDCRFVGKLVIPASVETIGEGAFFGLYNVSTMRFEGAAPAIGDNAFYHMYCSAYYDSALEGWEDAVSSVYGAQSDEDYGFRWVPLVKSGVCGDALTWSFDESTATLTVSGTGPMWDYSFETAWDEELAPWIGWCDHIEKIVLEEGITSIGYLAFLECENVKEMVLPESITTIHELSLPYLEALYVPAAVTVLGVAGPTMNCGAVYVDENNAVYSSIDGVLFNKDKTVLLGYPCTRTGAYAIPEGVETVSGWVFNNNANLTAITLPESLKTIEMLAFAGTSLTELRIPDGVTEIEGSAFSYCSALQKVVLGSGLENLNYDAFASCASLQEIVFTGDAPVLGDDVFREVTATVKYPAGNSTWTADVMQSWGGTLTWEASGGVENRVSVAAADLNGETTVWIDGVEYALQTDGDSCYVDLPDGSAETMVVYTYHEEDSSDVYTRYPVGMKVWILENTNGFYTAARVDALEDILQYSGMSIRVTGQKGLRMITSMDTGKKKDLISDGLAGYTLKEYGTVVAWTDQLGDQPLVLEQSCAKHNYAYKQGKADPVFDYEGDLMQYTNVLVGFSNSQCAKDLTMRPYMILQDSTSNEITLYGGTVQRSIGYIALQNRDTYAQGTGAYEYIWDIIHSVYGDAYDA